MSRIESEADFRALVREHFDRLPPQQQLVANYLLDSLREVPFLSVPELAQKSGVSDATVVRFAQRVGYSGFSGLKMDLLEALRQKMALHGGTSRSSRRRHEVESLEAVARQEMQNIERTLEELDRGELRRVTTALFKADHVFSFGMGISSHFAELLTYLMAQLGLRATTLSTRFSSSLEQLVPLRPTDLLVVFSLPPYSRQTIDMIEKTAQRGIPSVAICDRVTAPAARLADRVLTVRSDNLLFTNSFAALALLLNALVTEIAVRHQDHAFEALSRINRILAEDDDVIEDEENPGDGGPVEGIP